jgi:sec-independent protein translocase protein TatA
MTNLLFFSLPGGMEWFVILVVALLLFGKRLPEVARSMGRSITEFKRGLRNIQDEMNDELAEAAKKTEHPLEEKKVEEKHA